MTTTSHNTNSLPTYRQVCDAMEKYVGDHSNPQGKRQCVFQLISEYGERNHYRMVDVVGKLKRIANDSDFHVPKNDKADIFKIGCDIDNEGGFVAQQACFYIDDSLVRP